jgi:hypothetical protein
MKLIMDQLLVIDHFLNYFQTSVLLGLQQLLKEWMVKILEDFCNRIAAEIRLPEALNKNY